MAIALRKKRQEERNMFTVGSMPTAWLTLCIVFDSDVFAAKKAAYWVYVFFKLKLAFHFFVIVHHTQRNLTPRISIFTAQRICSAHADRDMHKASWLSVTSPCSIGPAELIGLTFSTEAIPSNSAIFNDRE